MFYQKQIGGVDNCRRKNIRVSNIFLHEPHLMIFLLDAHRVLVTIKQGIEFHLRPTQPCHSTEEKFVYVFNPSTPCRLLFAPAPLFVPLLLPFLRKYLFTSSICHHLLSTFSAAFFWWKISLLPSKSITCLLLDL